MNLSYIELFLWYLVISINNVRKLIQHKIQNFQKLKNNIERISAQNLKAIVIFSDIVSLIYITLYWKYHENDVIRNNKRTSHRD